MMFDLLIQQKSLWLVLGLILISALAHYYRNKVRLNETKEQQIIGDLYTVISMAWIFSFIAFAFTMGNELIGTRADSVIELQNLQDVQRHLRDQYQDLEELRRRHNEMTGIIRTFILIIGAIFPMVLFRVFKYHYKRLKNN